VLAVVGFMQAAGIKKPRATSKLVCLARGRDVERIASGIAKLWLPVGRWLLPLQALSLLDAGNDGRQQLACQVLDFSLRQVAAAGGAAGGFQFHFDALRLPDAT